jgi:Ca-activated chloride channel homolog
MTIFDRYSPPALPDAPFVMVDPPASSPLAGGAAVGIGRVRASDAGDPLLTNVSLQDVHIARSQDMTASTFGRALITSLQTPLVLVRDQPFRQALFGFDIHESDFPLRIGFPVLIENLSEWMLPPSVPSRSFHPDEAVTIVPETGATAVTVTRPDGSKRSLATGSIATFADTDQVGVYTVDQTVAGVVDRSWFAVNLFSDATSQLTPVDHLTLPPAQGSPSTQASHRGFLQVWPWIALLGLVLVLAEWLAFHRGL